MRIKIKNIDELVFMIGDKGYNITGFADQIEVSPSYFYKLIKGKHYPTPKMAAKISKGLDVPIEQIFYFENK